MLQTQVNYWNYVETNRHNLVMESQNAEDLQIKRDTLAETARHNKAGEDISWFNAQESQRHNQATEAIGWFSAKETQRHNIQTENIGFANVRLGYADLQERKRHNIVSEGQGERSIGIRATEAGARVLEAWTNMRTANQQIQESNARINLIEEQARTQQSVRFKNYTSGAEDITQSIGNLSHSIQSWIPKKTKKALFGGK